MFCRFCFFFQKIKDKRKPSLFSPLSCFASSSSPSRLRASAYRQRRPSPLSRISATATSASASDPASPGNEAEPPESPSTHPYSRAPDRSPPARAPNPSAVRRRIAWEGEEEEEEEEAMAAAVACRRAALLHGHQQWPQRWAAAPCPRSISQLVKTNGRRAFLVDTLALVSQASGVSPYRTLAPFRLPPALGGRPRCARPRGVRRNAPASC